jgi:hypothetical protein
MPSCRCSTIAAAAGRTRGTKVCWTLSRDKANWIKILLCNFL